MNDANPKEHSPGDDESDDEHSLDMISHRITSL
jgi:hypothetical protein